MSDMENRFIYPDKSGVLADIFGIPKPIIATLHLPPLPGSAYYDRRGMKGILETSKRELTIYLDCGVNGVIVENHGDIPFVKERDFGSETIAAMAAVAFEVGQVAAKWHVPIGINCLANAGHVAMSIAGIAGARFIRVNEWVNAYVANEGFIEGAAGSILRHRSRLGFEDVKIFADVHVKHGSHSVVADRPVRELSKDAGFFCADTLIATGLRTGDAPNPEEIGSIRAGQDLPLLIGSGLTPDNVDELLLLVDGAIVASYFKRGGVWQNEVEEDRLKTFMKAVQRVRDGVRK